MMNIKVVSWSLGIFTAISFILIESLIFCFAIGGLEDRKLQ